ncbi:hypothetical protein MchiMG62_14060 [Methanoculleus chikugoensis]|uniref:Uncharacterized protein n=1 Tax=Methanoculleus chikugoensis TaxID=118126 RepID=A0ABN5XLY7_9EURY|nr:hypothetical protein MchiMG62_14060 [Methanoculleus chikugoensis]
MTGTPTGTANPAGPYRVGPYPGLRRTYKRQLPALQSGKIAYWMYQTYSTTGIQKW